MVKKIPNYDPKVINDETLSDHSIEVDDKIISSSSDNDDELFIPDNLNNEPMNYQPYSPIRNRRPPDRYDG